jgi:tRNA(Ile)-lysidine synthase
MTPTPAALEGVRRRYAARLVGLDDLAGVDGVDGVGGRLVVGCSGGPDSLALLAVLRACRFDVVATYVDHGLRAAASHEAALVADAAARFGAAARTLRVSVEPGPNLEARARDARYAALEAVRAETGAVAIAVGHTADDQAETVFLNFLRGSGADGLAGMAAARGYVRRPLLALRRAETCELCAKLRLAPAHDVMNDDVRHRRVWLRREVFPALERGAARDLVPLLVRQAEVLRAETALLDDAVADVVEPDGPLDGARVDALPLALARRAVRRWLGVPPVGTTEVEAVLDVARGSARATELHDGRRVERVGNQLVAVARPAGVPPEPRVVEFPGRVTFAGVELESWVETAPPVAWPSGRDVCVVDADAVGSSATLRGARAGERFQPLGTGGTKTVFDALAECGVPSSSRGLQIVMAASASSTLPAGTPWWVLGYRIDARARVTSRTRRFLWLAASGTR